LGVGELDYGRGGESGEGVIDYVGMEHRDVVWILYRMGMNGYQDGLQVRYDSLQFNEYIFIKPYLSNTVSRNRSESF
jgi:hypothetical protein